MPPTARATSPAAGGAGRRSPNSRLCVVPAGGPGAGAAVRAGRPAVLWMLLACCAAFAGALQLTNLFASPDNVYDEVVYTQAAHNIATGGHLTWTNRPMLVHPPVSFLLQAAWLTVTGHASAPLADAIHAARTLTATAAAANVCLVALLAYRLAERASTGRRRVLMLVVAVVAALDPVLLRYSRLATIEPIALCACLVVLHLAWTLRRRSALVHVSAVGVTSGLALLTKEITVVLVVVPVLFALLERDRPLLRRSLAALGLGVALWLLFPLWALQLGVLGSFVDTHTSTLQRLVGLVQSTGWNRPGVSFSAAVLRSVSQYLASYLVLAAGLPALCWLWWRRSTTSGNFLTAWLTASYAFAAYMVGVGTLNEQFFVYVLPAAVVGSVFLLEAVLVRSGAGSTARAGSRLVLSAAVVALFALLVASSASWVRQYAGSSDGLARLTAYVDRELPACSTINTSGDEEKYSYLLAGRPLTAYAEGTAALSRGVHYFVLAPHDAVARYGNMSPELAAWIRGHGRDLASFPSRTYDGLQLWQVASSTHDPLSDVEYTGGGLYVNTVGSRCGGFTITDGADGDFFSGYTGLGGKGALGPPVTRAARQADGVVQVFDGAVLRATGLAGGDRGVSAAPVVAALAARAPEVYLRQVAPVLPGPAQGDGSGWLSDPVITRAYLGGDGLVDKASLAAAAERFGAPLGPPVAVGGDGTVRQPFADVVWERPGDGSPARLAPVGSVALQAGLVTVPASATQSQAPPQLPVAADPAQPTTVRPFLASLLAAVLLLALVVGLLSRRARRSWPPARRALPL